MGGNGDAGLFSIVIIILSMILKDIVEELQNEQADHPGWEDVTFRQKDVEKLYQLCKEKQEDYVALLDRRRERSDRLIRLKEELCRLSPEALEEIERDCPAKEEAESPGKEKRASNNKANRSKQIRKASDRNVKSKFGSNQYRH